MSSPLLTGEQLAFLKSLEESRVRYLVIGMGAAILQGVPGSTQDIDLWVEEGQSGSLRKACRRIGAVYVWRTSSPLVAGAGLDDFDLVWKPQGLRSFGDEYESSEEIELSPGVTVRVLPLERVMASKKKANRPKDRAQMPMLKDALRILRSGR